MGSCRVNGDRVWLFRTDSCCLGGVNVESEGMMGE